MIEDFPSEVVELVLQSSCQNALVNLAATNSRFNRLVKPHLFKSIEVNSQKRILSEKPEAVRFHAVQVTSIYNLKVLMKNLVSNETNCHLIQKLIFKQLPDLPEDFLINYFFHIFPRLVNLAEFKWYSTYNLDLTIVNLLPNIKLSKLNGNFKNFNNFNYDFRNLESLSLSGFKDFSNVSINLSTFINLKFLKISKKNLILYEDNLDNLFTNTSCLDLFALCLENLFLTKRDIELLVDKISFSGLKTLKLINCYELLNGQNSLLTSINESGASLQYLELDIWNNELNNEQVYKFLTSHRQLASVKINLNISENLIKQLTTLISQLNPVCLKHLEITFTIRSHNKINFLNHTDQKEILELLNSFKNLSTLKFPIFSANLGDLTFDLPCLDALQLNLIDYFKFKNCLIDLDITQLSVTGFNSLMKTLNCPKLQYIIIKLFEFHIYDVNTKVVSSLPKLVE
ncbi:hypothetical protein PSN45_001767 [Yamadazyma tenuis]|uniref:F-box domain-containing protein n=1 Tax=Candida tenuis (strain ATCC 10573 / BCRC 21748 / CBS 615 / JCM 9827 / NBRC 10315 / NRRL Y-1498 / VKM Y-70) TaxID=590646 RepID=G3BE78_CANTC|nr:uncharacterized protein CANTEDRAFT_116531 [Yamadazyma tenuis ATCC 10573]EGV60478.1 hypothetical protein CANTEDRAFT_116531 [Yamadazyma tenuis ATCC 10573]WEJ94283.1 hypothetical protein PSN45_001767 [Yamadazyma tenuis]